MPPGEQMFKFHGFSGPCPKVPPTTERIQKISAPGFPQFLFEWHPETQKVYIIALPGQFQQEVFVPGMMGEAKAQVLAEHCEHHARFYGFVQTYLRGYRQGDADRIVKSRTSVSAPGIAIKDLPSG